jgi:cell division initiation protein
VVQITPINEEKKGFIAREPLVTTTNLSSTIDNFIKLQPVVDQGIVSRGNSSKHDELEIIEGVGPKIALLLNDSGIFTFRDLAITPVYKIQEILEKAGQHFARHDPGTWTQQAKLAAGGRWDDLEALKIYLISNEPKNNHAVENEEPIIETPSPLKSTYIAEEIISTPKPEPIVVKESKPITQASEEMGEPIPSFAQLPVNPVENNQDSITEEMLEKVNKVKAAIRKAMVEKNEMAVKDHSPLPTLNDVIAKNEGTSGGSFFDNI